LNPESWGADGLHDRDGFRGAAVNYRQMNGSPTGRNNASRHTRSLYSKANIHAEAHFGRIDGVRSILEAKGDVNDRDSIGLTALMAASGQGHLALVRVLLSCKADASVVDKTSLSALDHAKRKNRFECIEELEGITSDRFHEREAKERQRKEMEAVGRAKDDFEMALSAGMFRAARIKLIWASVNRVISSVFLQCIVCIDQVTHISCSTYSRNFPERWFLHRKSTRWGLPLPPQPTF